MKEAIGGSWLFVLVIAFVSLFAGFISLSVNYSKCYKVKDEILSTIQRKHGVNKSTLEEINDYLLNIGYRNTGVCPDNDGCWNAFSINSTNGPAGYGSRTNYCIKKVARNDVTKTSTNVTTNTALGHPEASYYSVMVFFAIDMPIIRNTFALRLMGDTSIIYLTNDFENMVNGSTC